MKKRGLIILVVLALFSFIQIIVILSNKNSILGKDIFNEIDIVNINTITAYIEEKKIIVDIIQPEIIEEIVSIIHTVKLKESSSLKNFKPQNQLYLKKDNDIINTILIDQKTIIIDDVFYKDVHSVSETIISMIEEHVENPNLVPVEISSLIDEDLLTNSTKVLMNNQNCTEYIEDIYNILISMKLQKLPYRSRISGGGTLEFQTNGLTTQMLVFHGDRVNLNGEFYLMDESYFDQIYNILDRINN